MPKQATKERTTMADHPDYRECWRCESAPGVPFSWIKRVPGRPKRCPNCNSPRWDSARRLPRRKETSDGG